MLDLPSESRPSQPSAEPDPIESLITKHYYANDNVLQYYEVFTPPKAPSGSQSSSIPPDEKVWVIYIHGGAYRDPTITSHTFLPLLHSLYPSLSPPTSSAHNLATTPHIASIASLSYRLSPHPSYPQPSPPTTPPSHLRTAKHPDHITDILLALSHLQKTYAFGNRYILIGHSVGATLAYQVGMRCSIPWELGKQGKREVEVKQPLAIVGVEGIYDVPKMLERHKDEEIYGQFVRGALGEDEGVWKGVSPARWGREGFVRSWKENVVGKGEGGGEVLAVVVHSRGDELVEWGQVEDMEGCLKKKEGEDEGKRGEDGIEYRFIEVKGRHHEVWSEGRELARVVGEVVGKVVDMMGWGR
ncbi:MAG: hypothetical protein Q9227_002462 [Pyrenula ochraceoflavens]